MSTPEIPQGKHRLTLLTPAYEVHTPIDFSWRPDTEPPRGHALAWWLGATENICAESRWLERRPAGVPLFIILPRPAAVVALRQYLDLLPAAHPRAVLPEGELANPRTLARLLATPPLDLSASVTEYLHTRGAVVDTNALEEIRLIFRLAPQVNSLSKLTRKLYMSRRTLGRHFEVQHLPVPSHWLQFARLLHVSIHLQHTQRSAGSVASMFGYPDAFTMSNQMKRLVGCRPTDVKSCLGWEWIVESWLRREQACSTKRDAGSGRSK